MTEPYFINADILDYCREYDEAEEDAQGNLFGEEDEE